MNRGEEDQKMDNESFNFSGKEIVLLATEIEKAGYTLYRLARKLAPTRKLKEVFENMAQDEQEHIRVIINEIAPRFVKAQTSWEDDETVAGYLQKTLSPDIFPSTGSLKLMIRNITTQEEALKFCLDGEKKSVKFYQEVLKFAERQGEGQEAVKRILEEEKLHVAKLEKLMEG